MRGARVRLHSFYNLFIHPAGSPRYDERSPMSTQALVELRYTNQDQPLVWRAVWFGERVASVVLLLLLAPLWLPLAIAIGLLSRRTPVIAVLRVGQFGKPLWLFKFRTMWSSSESRDTRLQPVEYIVD